MQSENFQNPFLPYRQNVMDHIHKHLDHGSFLAAVFCEFTPCEIVHAAGGWSVGMCGGCHETTAIAERELPASLCPLIKSSYGYHLARNNEYMELASLVIGETTCDGKKKMFERLGETRHTHILELPQKVADPDARRHWYTELQKLKNTVEKISQRPLTNENLHREIIHSNTLRRNRLKLLNTLSNRQIECSIQTLMRCHVPISGMISSEEHTRLTHVACAEIEKMTAQNSRCPRVLVTGVPLTNTAVLDWIEAEGGYVVAMENCTGLKPYLRTIDENDPDPLHALAEYYIDIPCSVSTPNTQRINDLQFIKTTFSPDVVIEIIWHGCLTYDVESFFVRRWAETQGLPYLKLHLDFSPAQEQAVRTRIAALLEMAR